LFTVLSGQAVVLPYERTHGQGPLVLLPDGALQPLDVADVIPVRSDWRIIATMNVFDKALLFEMSYALMRRFAFIEVRSPERDVFCALINRWAGEDQIAEDVATALLDVRKLKDVGPAVYRDIARYVARRRTIDTVSKGQLVFDSFYSFLLPQFEGIDDEQGRALMDVVVGAAGQAFARQVRETLNRVLDLELRDQSSAPAGEPASPDPAVSVLDSES
jgi:hypothetical protein